MTLHAFIQYLKYKRRAKGRHDTHSPFVYGLVEQVLMHTPPEKLIEATARYAGGQVMIVSEPTGSWQQAVSTPGVAVMVFTDIHANAVHTQAWQAVCNLPEVLLSVDLYTCGMLFFSEAFKEKQHFVLKYPY